MSKVDELKATFKRWDTDGSGAITKDELFAIFRALDPTFMEVELEEMMAEADVNKDGQIDINEFIDWCTSDESELSIPQGEIWEEKMKLVKEEAMAQYSGWSKKVEKHFEQLKTRLSSEAFTKQTVSMFLAGEDDNNDGLISYAEVKDLIEPTFEAIYAQNSGLRKRKLDETTIKAAFDAHDTADAGKGKMGKTEFSNLIKYLQVLNASVMMSETVAMWEEEDA